MAQPPVAEWRDAPSRWRCSRPRAHRASQNPLVIDRGLDRKASRSATGALAARAPALGTGCAALPPRKSTAKTRTAAYLERFGNEPPQPTSDLEHPDRWHAGGTDGAKW